MAENLLLRQQLLVASRQVKQPKLWPWERGLFVVLASRLGHWREAALLVEPDSVIRWHREGFRVLWRRKSKSQRLPKPRLPQEVIDLIARISNENWLWGAQRGAERVRGSQKPSEYRPPTQVEMSWRFRYQMDFIITI